MPFVVSKNLFVMPVVTDKILAALSAIPAAALFPTPNVHLYTNPAVISRASVIATFTEAAWTGYLQQALPALLGPYNIDTNNRGMQQDVTFGATAAVTPSVLVYGVFITDTTNAILWAAEAFANPIPFANAGDFLTYEFNFGEQMQRTLTP